MSIRIGNVVSNVEKDLGNAAKSVGNAVKNTMENVKDDFINVGGAAIGYAEMAGLKYPVKQYSMQLSPGLTRGSRLDEAGMEKLKAQGFKSTVNLCAENNTDAGLAAKNGMSSLHLPIIDNTVPSEATVKQFLDFATNPKNQPCYVHCEAGVGRTGVMSAAYRMAVQGWTPGQALAEAKNMGCAMPDQQQFILKLGQDLADGKIPGYPRSAA
jgi:protein-tyrosine phosphatase